MNWLPIVEHRHRSEGDGDDRPDDHAFYPLVAEMQAKGGYKDTLTF